MPPTAPRSASSRFAATPIRGACGRQLVDPGDVAISTVKSIVEICETSGFDVCIIVGQPSEAAPSDFAVDTATLNAELRAYARDHPATTVFLDCGSSVGAADGSYNALLRDSDGVHLNQRGQDAFARCLADGAF